jgi:ribosomal protein L11 methylase PrmA
VLSHVVLPARFQAAAQNDFATQAKRIKARRLPRIAFRNMLTGLRRWIESLQPAGIGASKWANYAVSNTYESRDTAAKVAFVRRFAEAVKPAMLWDFGCNQGGYSEAALEAGAGEAIGFDSDRTALEAAFDNAAKRNLKLLPLFLDAADPSPAQGWRGQEHMSLKDRSPADGLLALAFVHHLVMGRNIPLSEAVSWLIGLAPEGVIEFVEKDDPTIGQMLTLRQDIFRDYHREAFLAAVRAHAEIVEQEEVIQNRRLLVWYRRRP